MTNITPNNPLWNALTKKVNINFQAPTTNNSQNNMSTLIDRIDLLINNDKYNDYNNNMNALLSLLSISTYNQYDLCHLLVTQYQASNLSINEFISRSALLAEMRESIASENNDISNTKQRVLNLFENFLQSYIKYISKPLPISCDALPDSFKSYNDKIDIVLKYIMRVNRVNEHLIQVRPAQFDVYFAPPNTPHDFGSYVDGSHYYKSGPGSRYHPQYKSGLDDIYTLFSSERCNELMHDLQNCKKRLILLIVRGNEYDTNDDVLYLFTKDSQYPYNEISWNLNNKHDDIFMNNTLLNISYHLHNNCNRTYINYNGFGERVIKQNVVKKLPSIFTANNGKNKISNQILKEFNAKKGGFNDFVQSDECFEFGAYLFGLKYQRTRFNDTKCRLLNIPRATIANATPQIREFDDPQNQLYYYLTWTCKMQVIDEEFSEYRLCDNQEIAIFNSELHEKYSNMKLYVVSVPNAGDGRKGKPKWNMHAMMNSHEIYQKYGIDSVDLPKGSRYIHNYFQQEMTENNLNLHSDTIGVNNWNKIKKVVSQKFEGDANANFNGYNLNKCVKDSIDAIRSNKNKLSLIPILRINAHQKSIKCEPLIPIILSDKHIAVSYKIINNKLIINELYIDPIDIMSKAALVDANAVATYKYLCKNAVPVMPAMPMQPNWSLTSNKSNQSVTDQTWIINSLQQQLKDALQRESMLLNTRNSLISTPMKSFSLPVISTDAVLSVTNKSITNTPNTNNSPIPVPNSPFLKNGNNPYTFACNFSSIPAMPVMPALPPLALNTHNIAFSTISNPMIQPNPLLFPSLSGSPPVPASMNQFNLPLISSKTASFSIMQAAKNMKQ